MKRYYVVHVKLIWGMVLLSFASLLWNGVQFFSQKDNLIEERKNQKEVSYEYKKIEFAHSKVKDSRIWGCIGRSAVQGIVIKKLF